MKNLLLLFAVVFIVQDGIGQCSNDGNQWAKSWTSCTTTTSPNALRPDSHWILYEFASNHYIDSSHIWNANRVGESGAGIKDIIVDYSLDGTTWVELGSYTIPQASESENYQGVIGPNFGSIYINKILITVLSTHDSGSCATIGEILFSVDPSKCHGEIDDCGTCNGPGAPTWYADKDGDGKGALEDMLVACDQPFGYVNNADDECDNGQLGWAEIAPLFQNSCNGCHIANTSGGLNLGSYQSFSQGGFNCGSNITTGTTLVGVITIDSYDGCVAPISFPAMNNRTGTPMTEIELAILQRWINGGAPEHCIDFCPENEVVDMTFAAGTIAYRQTSNEISSSALIESATLITFDAGQEMILDTGFSILQGGQFIAKIEGCE